MQRRITDGARQGSYQRVNPQGVIVEEAFFSNDTLHRQRVLYYPNGDTLTVEHYQNGSFEGPFRQYYENGTLQLQGQFAESKAAGEWRQYYDSGELMEIVTFQDNLENGPFVEYYRNGNLKAEGAYLNGDNEQGPLNLYDENGTLIRKMNCEEGICRTIWSSESE